MAKRKKAAPPPVRAFSEETLPLFPPGDPGYRSDGKYDKPLKLTARPFQPLTEAQLDRAQRASRTRQLPCGPDCACHHPAEYNASQRKNRGA